MTFLPIVGRELRRAARKRTTYWLRSGAGSLAMLAFFWIWVGERIQGIPGSGTRLFTLLNVGAFLFCLLAGAVFTADCISEEKREGTWGLLFLTRLRGHDIILGKLAGGTLGAFYGFIAILPVLTVPIILGGVTLTAVAYSCLALGNTLFLSVSAGILISTCCRRDRIAIGATVLSVLILAFALPGLDRYQQGAGWVANPFWSILSPAVSLFLAQDLLSASRSGLFWPVWLAQHGLGWILIATACLLAPRLITERWVGGSRSLRWMGRFAEAADHALSPPTPNIALVDANPYRWLAARGRLHPLLLWVLLGSAALLGTVVTLASAGSPVFGLLCMLGATVLLQGLVKAWMISEAVHRFGEDRRLGTLELLLGSRITPDEMLHDQRRALRERLLGPAAFALLASLVVCAAGAASPRASGGAHAIVGWWMISMVVMFIDLRAIETVGPWVGLSVARSNRAVLVAAWQMLVVPWLVFVALLLLFGLDWRVGFSLGHAWLVVCSLCNLVWWSHASAGWAGEYRRLATERAGSRGIPAAPPEPEPVSPRGIADLLTPVPSR